MEGIYINRKEILTVEEFIREMEKSNLRRQKEYAKDKDYIYVQQSEFALLHYAKEKIPQCGWSYRLPIIIEKEPNSIKDIDLDLPRLKLPFYLSKHIFKNRISYYKIEYYPNHEDRENQLPTIVYGLEGKFMNFIYQDIITELTKYQIIYIRYMEKNKGEVYTNLMDIDKIFIKSNEYLTFYSATSNLYDKFNTYLKMPSFSEKILKLMEEIKNSSFRDYRIGFNNKTIYQLSLLENNLIMIRLKILFDMTSSLISINQAAEKLKLNPGTIKHACQIGKLLNTKKIGKTWLVDLNEIIEMREKSKNKEFEKLKSKRALLELKIENND